MSLKLSSEKVPNAYMALYLKHCKEAAMGSAFLNEALTKSRHSYTHYGSLEKQFPIYTILHIT